MIDSEFSMGHLLGDKTFIPEGENERSECDILGEILEALIWNCWCTCCCDCCFILLIITRWMDVCVVTDDVDGDGDMDEIRGRLLWNSISSNCSWAISGGGGGGSGSSECDLGGNFSGLLLSAFFIIVENDPLVLTIDRCWLDVSGVPRTNELFTDLLPLKWCKIFWKCDNGLTGVGGGRSIVERDIRGEAWTSKLLAIIVDEVRGWEEEADLGRFAGDMDLIVLVLSCEHRFLTKINVLFYFLFMFFLLFKSRIKM